MDENTENEVVEQEAPAEEVVENDVPEETPAEHDEPAEEPSSLDSFLDTISEGAQEQKADEPESDPEPEQQEPEQPMTADDVEKELLSGVKSERSRDRVKDFIKDHKSMESEYQNVKKINDDFATMVRNTGMSPEEFGRTIEYCRLASSNSPDDLRIALQIVEEQRKNLCMQLGIDAPGVDPLEGFDELKGMVNAYEMPAKEAAELARLRKREAEYNRQMQAQAQQQQHEEMKRQEVVNFQRVANDTFRQLAQTDPNYKQKEQVLLNHIKQNNVMQHFMQNLRPSQWAGQLKMMYDMVQVQPVIRNTPLRARPARISGNAELNIPEGPERIAALLDNLGI